MPRKGAKDTVPLFVELPPELDQRLRERCEQVGVKLADEVRLALRRHLDYPPADITPSLPDAVPSPARRNPPRAGRRARGRKGET